MEANFRVDYEVLVVLYYLFMTYLPTATPVR